MLQLDELERSHRYTNTEHINWEPISLTLTSSNTLSPFKVFRSRDCPHKVKYYSINKKQLIKSTCS